MLYNTSVYGVPPTLQFLKLNMKLSVRSDRMKFWIRMEKKMLEKNRDTVALLPEGALT